MLVEVENSKIYVYSYDANDGLCKAFPDCAGKILKIKKCWQKWLKSAQKVLKISK